MASSSKDSRSINTGGGAYVGGAVNASGDVVGRDQVKTVYQHQEGASVAELAKLLSEVRNLLAQAELDPETAEIIEGDFQVVEAQAAKEQPKGSLIKTKLKGISEMIQEAGKNADAVDKLLKLLAKGTTMVGSFF